MEGNRQCCIGVLPGGVSTAPCNRSAISSLCNPQQISTSLCFINDVQVALTQSQGIPKHPNASSAHWQLKRYFTCRTIS